MPGGGWRVTLLRTSPKPIRRVRLGQPPKVALLVETSNASARGLLAGGGSRWRVVARKRGGARARQCPSCGRGGPAEAVRDFSWEMREKSFALQGG